MRCAQCAHENVSGAAVCVGCGSALTAPDSPVHPGETFRDPDDMSFPVDAVRARRTATRAPIKAPAMPDEKDDFSTEGDRQPRFLDERRPPRLPADVPMRDIAASLRPDARRASEPLPIRYAGFIRRGIAFVIDMIVLAIFTIPLTIGGLIALRVGLVVSDLPQTFATDDTLTPLISLGCSLMFIIYFTVLHSGSGQTIGKALLGIGVRSIDLQSIGIVRSLLRAIAYVVSAAVFGLGFIMIALTPRKRGWHDYVAGTCVVRLRPKEI
jgi:uncharacterized RDD family membrane protein YckC